MSKWIWKIQEHFIPEDKVKTPLNDQWIFYYCPKEKEKCHKCKNQKENNSGDELTETD